ncbi:MAG: protein kinase, partial [Planctomycetota bacterium]|nr:protein kinase [Planctomycetota bacterium]
IKPSNILVTLHDGTPVPKVIDFGIAKATEGRLTDATVYTQLHQFIGTPAYMSPEQAEMSGLDIDTRTDIYSLGVLLYELLTGSTPFDARELMAQGIDAMRRTIRETEPVRPSTRLTRELARTTERRPRPTDAGPAIPTAEEITADERRHLRLKEQIARVKGDLDWIVMKCLEKDRSRRYETANGLAADIIRHLTNEPVTARPPSASYRFHKAFRRNRLVLGAVAAVGAAMLAGLIALGFALSAQRQQAVSRQAAVDAEERTTATARFIASLLDEAVPKLLEREDRVGIRILLDTADRMVVSHLTNSPTAEHMIRFKMGWLFVTLDEYVKASEQFSRVEALIPRLSEKVISQPERDHLRVNAAALRMTIPNGEQQAVPRLHELREELLKREAKPAQLIAVTLVWEGLAGLWNGRFDQAEPLYQEAVTWFSPRSGADLENPAWLNVPSFYARALVLQGRFAQAEPHARHALVFLRRIDGVKATETHSSLVWSLCGQGRFDEADAFLRSRLASPDAWDSNQLAALEALRGAVSVAAGHREAAVPRLRALAERPEVNSDFWMLGVLATIAAGDTNGYGSLIQKGLERYAGGAHTMSAHNLLMAIGAGSPSPEALYSTSEVVKRVEDSPTGIWTFALPIDLARLECRRGRFEEALAHLERWHSIPVNSLVERTVHRMEMRNAHPYYLRTLILASLGRPAAEVTAAYLAGRERHHPERPGEMRHLNSMMMMEQDFLDLILRSEAEVAMHARNILVPDLPGGP